MRVDVRFQGLEWSHALSAYAVRRTRLQLSRFDGMVRRVLVSIGDVNGPRGGADKRCQVTMRGPALGTISVVDLSADAYSAVDLVLERAARAVGRNVERTRSLRRHDIRTQES